MFKNLFFALVSLTIVTSAAVAPASAQMYDRDEAPAYNSWQAGWDRYEYDRHHVILGRVTNFSPYRLEIERRDGDVQMIDLKNGTVLLPTGVTPRRNERVAIVGYYSHGTFIANRVIVRG